MSSSGHRGDPSPAGRTLIDTSTPSDPIHAMIEGIRSRVIGQERAVEAVVQGLEIDYAGLLRPGELAMHYLFAGPPGVGKTQMAYEVAYHWIGRLLRSSTGRLLEPISLIDCTLYVDRHDVANLKGSTKGYVGYEDKTPLAQDLIDRYAREVIFAEEAALQLAEKARRNPDMKTARLTPKEVEKLMKERVDRQAPFKKVLLFDEVGRAHPNLWNILITILNGKPFEFGDGSNSDFSRAALLMSDNTNEQDIRQLIKGGIGFNGDWREADAEKLGEMIYRQTLQKIEKAFPTAFVSRIRKNIIVFRALDTEDWKRILELRLSEYEELFLRATGKDPAPVTPVFTDGCKEFLLEHGIDRLYGARPLAQVMRKHVLTRLAKAINMGVARPGDRIVFERVRTPKDRLEIYVER